MWSRVAAVLFVTSTALAQPGPDSPPGAPDEDTYRPEPNHALSLEPTLGGISPGSGVLALGLAASWRAPGSETWWRVAITPGHPIADISGHMIGVRAGIEHRRAYCLRGCLYTGLDLALVDLTADDYPEHTELRAALAVARGGIDVGGDTFRVRLGLELFVGLGMYHQQLPDLVMPIDTTDLSVAGGMAFTSALAARF